MQTVTLTIHIVGALLSLYLYRVSRRWRYAALMFLLSSGIGVLFYIMVLLQVPSRHELSLYRSLAQAVLIAMIALGMIVEGKDA